MCACVSAPSLQAKFSINDESRKVADNILIKDESYSAQTFVLDVPKLERALTHLREATGAIRQSFAALAQIQIERRTHSVAQVESEQQKLETQVRSSTQHRHHMALLSPCSACARPLATTIMMVIRACAHSFHLHHAHLPHSAGCIPP